ncbi:NAD(P)/FAD-dependent oxidoreductase [Streptococcus sp. DD12]|uniref:NAD(P)/FAD-dependent oxidoreductase n=1 Tax=Streptococcus sp. DD12 TaxID=1777880 RepID=UPI00079B03BB|nr:NAD(P)/FAD-dependent oxidoreductase [Streptococcus sp. DD12]KXT76164.1 Thioredoxin reductase [Streptococcus sp. DD12]
MTEEKHIDITIIGGGPVGLFAAYYAGMRGMQVKIIESLAELGGQPAILYPEKKIYDIPAFPAVTGQELTDRLLDQLALFDDRITVCLKEEVLSFEQTEAGYTITTDKGQHQTGTILIACGNGAFAPRPLGVPEEESYAGNNLHYIVRNLQDFKDQDVVLMGGGDSAVDWALALEPIAKSVALVHRRDKFRAHEHSVEKLEASSVAVYTPYTPAQLKGDGQKVSHILLNKVKSDESITLPLDSLIVNYGFSTNSKHLKSWGLDHKRTSVLVSPTYETNLPGIFAIGDAAEYDGKLDLIAVGFGEAPLAVNQAILHLYPERDNRLIHSSSLFD